jgi:aspartate/methionine/tyrosine aminotransferase
LRRALARWDGGDRVAEDNVVVTHGAKGALLALFASLIEPGDEVIHPLPCYPAYPVMVRRFGGVPVGVPESAAGFEGWSAAVERALTGRTRAVVLASPSNPSGSIIPAAELAGLVERCSSRGVRVVLDEAYAAFRFDGGGFGHRDRCAGGDPVRIGSASKTFALPGWRMGWLVAEPELAGRTAQAQAALLNPPATPPQRALLALSEVSESYFEANRRLVRERIEAVVGAMGSAGLEAATPAGGFYVWVDVRDRLAPGESSAEWCRRLAAERGVGLWPGEDFGVPGFVRLSLPQGDGWPETVRELERRLTAAVG